MAALANVLFYIIFSKRCCWIHRSFTLHKLFILKPKITLICFHSLYHSLSLVVPLVVICSHSLSLVIIHCHSFSFVVTRCTTRCHSLPFAVPLVVIRCHSLSLDVPLVCLFINDRFPTCEPLSEKKSFSVVINQFRKRKLTMKGGKNIFIKYISAQKDRRNFKASKFSNNYEVIILWKK